MWLITLLPIFFYFRLLNGFFQQDEWYGFAWYLLHKDSIGYVFAPSVGHFNPLNLLINHGLFALWGMDYSGFLIVSLILHATVIILIYVLAKEIFKSTKLAMITAFIFSALASHYQGTAWVIANIATQGATILGLFSTILFLRKRILLSLSLLILSLLIKEITIGLFPLYLLFWFLFFKKQRTAKNFPVLIITFAAAFAIFRFSMFFLPNSTGDQLVTQSQDLLRLFYNFITVPVKSLSQSIIPIEFLINLSKFIARFFPESISGKLGSPAFEVFAVKRVLEAISLLSAAAIATLGFILARRSKIVWIGLAWVIFCSFIFAFAPERSGVIFTIDSRNLYFVSIGASLLLASILDKYTEFGGRKMLVILVLVTLLNLYFLNASLVEITDRGNLRKHILSTISVSYPKLPSKVVIYVESNKSYYGLPPEVKILPFQSGFGQTLLAWYYPTEKFPIKFFADRYLWEIDEQGYKELEDRGFGYFRDKNLLLATVKKYNLPGESVLAFSWDGNRNLLTNITEEVRKEIYDQKNP